MNSRILILIAVLILFVGFLLTLGVPIFGWTWPPFLMLGLLFLTAAKLVP